MRIIFTDKLSKMVAQWENLQQWCSSWDPGDESILYHGQDLLTGKTLSSPNSKPYQQPE